MILQTITTFIFAAAGFVGTITSFFIDLPLTFHIKPLLEPRALKAGPWVIPKADEPHLIQPTAIASTPALSWQ